MENQREIFNWGMIVCILNKCNSIRKLLHEDALTFQQYKEAVRPICVNKFASKLQQQLTRLWGREILDLGYLSLEQVFKISSALIQLECFIKSILTLLRRWYVYNQKHNGQFTPWFEIGGCCLEFCEKNNSSLIPSNIVDMDVILTYVKENWHKSFPNFQCIEGILSDSFLFYEHIPTEMVEMGRNYFCVECHYEKIKNSISASKKRFPSDKYQSMCQHFVTSEYQLKRSFTGSDNNLSNVKKCKTDNTIESKSRYELSEFGNLNNTIENKMNSSNTVKLLQNIFPSLLSRQINKFEIEAIMKCLSQTVAISSIDDKIKVLRSLCAHKLSLESKLKLLDDKRCLPTKISLHLFYIIGQLKRALFIYQSNLDIFSSLTISPLEDFMIFHFPFSAEEQSKMFSFIGDMTLNTQWTKDHGKSASECYFKLLVDPTCLPRQQIFRNNLCAAEWYNSLGFSQSITGSMLKNMTINLELNFQENIQKYPPLAFSVIFITLYNTKANLYRLNTFVMKRIDEFLPNKVQDEHHHTIVTGLGEKVYFIPRNKLTVITDHINNIEKIVTLGMLLDCLLTDELFSMYSRETEISFLYSKLLQLKTN